MSHIHSAGEVKAFLSVKNHSGGPRKDTFLRGSGTRSSCVRQLHGLIQERHVKCFLLEPKAIGAACLRIPTRIHVFLNSLQTLPLHRGL